MMDKMITPAEKPRVSLVPYTILEKISRPIESVPKICFPSGGLNLSSTVILYGSTDVKILGNIDADKMTKIINSPIRPIGFFPILIMYLIIFINPINKGAGDYGRQAVGESAPCAGV